MIWLLLLICIYGTICCIENLFSILGTHIGCITINQTIDILTEQKADINKLTKLVHSRTELVEIRSRQQSIFTIISIVLSILWPLFFYLWN